MFHTSVDGVTVSIGAFQALVPGSTPGRRILFLVFDRISSSSYK